MDVAVDARMLHHSGIGRYLRCNLPRLVAGNPDLRFHLLGDSQRLAGVPGLSGTNVRRVECDADIYTLREQLQVPRRIPKAARLLWVPHYAIPLSYTGRLLVTVHDLCHVACWRLFGGPHRLVYARGMLEAVRRRADAIITVSRFTRDEFLRRVGSPAGAIHVVHNGVDESWCVAGGGEARPIDDPYFLFVGNLKPHKNMGVVPSALARLPRHLPHCLAVVGRDAGMRTVDSRAKAEATATGVRTRLLGEVSDARLRALLWHAEALVLPSLYEGFGLPALEAMACGCPVIAARAGALPEVCAEAALYFDPRLPEDLAGQLLRIASEPGLRRRLRDAGLDRSRRFAWGETASRTSLILRDLLLDGEDAARRSGRPRSGDGSPPVRTRPAG